MIIRFAKTNLEIDLQPGKLVFLTIENPSMYYDFYMSATDKSSNSDGMICALDDNGIIDFYKNISVIGAPSDISLTENNVKKRLYQEMAITVQEDDLNQRLTAIHNELITLVEEVSIRSGLDIEICEEVESKDLFSLIKVIPAECNGSFCERLINYARYIHALLGKKAFIVINCDGFLTPCDYSEIAKEIVYMNVGLLFVNSRQVVWEQKEREYIIDFELCELY